MRNLIRVSEDFGLHYSNSSSTTGLENFAGESNHGFEIGIGIGLDIPLDAIEDIFWATDDVAGWFFDPKTDIKGYFDDFNNNGNIISAQVHGEEIITGDTNTETDMALKQQNAAMVKDHHTSVDQESYCKQADDQKPKGIEPEANEKKNSVLPMNKAAFERKLKATKRKIHGEKIIIGDTLTDSDMALKQPIAAMVEDHPASVDQESCCKQADDQKPRGIKPEANEKKNSVLPMDKAAFERKHTATKQKIQDAYDEKTKKRRTIKIVEFLPTPAKSMVPIAKIKGRTCHKKDLFSGPKKNFVSRRNTASSSRLFVRCI